MDTFDQKRYEQLKKELRKAIKSNDLDRIYQTATSGLEEFETIGFPDDWSMWQRAIDDVGYAKLYGKKV